MMSSALRLLAVVVGAIFIYAGVLKALDPARFATDIGNFKLLPWHATVLLALYLPWLEIICGIALIFRQLYSGALLLLGFLCLVFLGALGLAKARGLDIACGCFGRMLVHSVAVSIAIDLGILAALLVLWNEAGRKDCR
ncbi:MAG: MauE/DoxX family redox-associated membrane protein [Chthoniobacteraceae bacterium]